MAPLLTLEFQIWKSLCGDFLGDFWGKNKLNFCTSDLIIFFLELLALI